MVAMSPRLRKLLLIVGLAMLALALVALAYAGWPLAQASEQAPLPTGLFMPP